MEGSIVFTLIAGAVAFFWLRGREQKIKTSCQAYLEDELSGRYSDYRQGEPLRRLSSEVLKGHLLMLICGSGIGVGFNQTVWQILSALGL